jgi:hypothetical protein
MKWLFNWWRKNKFVFERWRSNVGIGQFAMTVYIAIVNGFPIWLLLIGIIGSIIYTIRYDIPKIYPTETSDGFTNNPLNMEMLNILRKWQQQNEAKEPH